MLQKKQTNPPCVLGTGGFRELANAGVANFRKPKANYNGSQNVTLKTPKQGLVVHGIEKMACPTTKLSFLLFKYSCVKIPSFLKVPKKVNIISEIVSIAYEGFTKLFF
jgi:hypothetical protein